MVGILYRYHPPCEKEMYMLRIYMDSWAVVNALTGWSVAWKCKTERLGT